MQCSSTMFKAMHLETRNNGFFPSLEKTPVVCLNHRKAMSRSPVLQCWR